MCISNATLQMFIFGNTMGQSMTNWSVLPLLPGETTTFAQDKSSMAHGASQAEAMVGQTMMTKTLTADCTMQVHGPTSVPSFGLVHCPQQENNNKVRAGKYSPVGFADKNVPAPAKIHPQTIWSKT